MAHEALQAVVGTAIVDSTFCRGLLAHQVEVTDRFGLTAEEAGIVDSIQADSLADFAAELDCWICRRAEERLIAVL